MDKIYEERLYWIRTRRSTRRFQEKKVEEEKLSAVLDAARHAPSGSLTVA